MNARTVAEYALGAIVIIVVGSLFLGQVLGQPVLLGFVETGSMAPTLQPGDGFVAAPMFTTGPVEEGDVIVFHAETLHGGGLTTHRVVGETGAGFITRGDANPVTDQDSGEPPVGRDQIVAKALQIGGSVVVLPNLGLLVTGVNDVLSTIQRQLAVTLGTRAILGTQGIAYLLFAIGILSYVASLILSSGQRMRTRQTKRQTGMLNARLVIVALTAILLVIVTASMVVPSGMETFDIVSSDTDAPGSRVIAAGGAENVTYVVPSNGLMPTTVYLEPASDGIEITPRRLDIGSGEQRNATITLFAPPETGAYQRQLIEHRYVTLLPRSTIDTLYSIHPWLPIIVIDLLLGLGFAGIASTVVGWGTIRVDSRNQRSFMTRLRRWLR